MNTLESLADRWPALSALLDEALRLPADRRQAWLQALPEPAAGLRGVLQGLLASQAAVETGSFLVTLPKIALPASADDAPGAGQVGAGDTVGPYRLLSRLGHGGMGEVWLAERVDGELKRRVALKLPRVVWGGAFAERLRRERDILATLAHPHIARLYDAGVDAQGRPYLALEHVEGEPIDAYCRARGLAVAARLDLLLQVAAAVAHAHSRLVVHRDLKPSNILVGDNGHVTLLDFGIAKLIEGEETQETQLTRASGRALTLDYASPEQIRGEPLGTPSDVYSLAVVAYELLSGAKPYRLKRGSAAELEEAIAGVDPGRASDAATAAADRSALRGDLDAILARALRKDAAERYPTVDAFADDIERHRRGQAVAARPDSRMYLARKFVLRHRVPVAALTAVVVALGVGLGVALQQTGVARANERRAALAVDREEAVKAMYVETLSTVAASDSEALAKPGAVPSLLQSKLAEFEKRYADQPEQHLGLLEAVTAQLPFMGDYEGTVTVGRRYLDLLRRHHADDVRLLRATLVLGRALYNLGRLRDSETELRSGLASVPERTQTLQERSGVIVELAKVLARTGKREEARQLLTTTVARLEAVRPVSELWEAMQHLGRLHTGYDEPTALAWMQRSHAGTEKNPIAWTGTVGASHLYRGIALHNAGRPGEAEADLREAVRRFDELFGPTDRDAVWATAQLAGSIAAQGRYDEARQLLAARTAAVSERADADAPGTLATLAARRLEVELQFGDVATAGSLAKVDVASALQRPAARGLAEYVVAEAAVLRARGQAQAAADVVAQWQRSVPAEQRAVPDDFRAAIALAECQLALGRVDAAASGLREVIGSMQRAGATATWTFRRATELAALTRARAGDAAGAAAALAAFDAAQGATPLPAPSLAERADSALRLATVQLANEHQSEATTLVAALATDLAGQHPSSPRLAEARRLAGAASP